MSMKSKDEMIELTEYLDSTGVFRDAVIGILAAIAKQEKVRISERTKAGLERARRHGKSLGRPKVSLDAGVIRSLRAKGLSWAVIAAQTGIARSTAQRAVTN
jgi:DNA invertase Pin-like site-specific DNA recombinase